VIIVVICAAVAQEERAISCVLFITVQLKTDAKIGEMNGKTKVGGFFS
jgi:hypothetical protein